MSEFIKLLIACNARVAPKQLTDRDIQLIRDVIKRIAESLETGDLSMIETALQLLRTIERKYS